MVRKTYPSLPPALKLYFNYFSPSYNTPIFTVHCTVLSPHAPRLLLYSPFFLHLFGLFMSIFLNISDIPYPPPPGVPVFSNVCIPTPPNLLRRNSKKRFLLFLSTLFTKYSHTKQVSWILIRICTGKCLSVSSNFIVIMQTKGLLFFLSSHLLLLHCEFNTFLN
jgi:hypothetical protein